MRLAMENYESIVAGFDVFFQRNRKNLLSMEKAYLIGAGANYGTALEGAVKIGETVHILAVGYEVDEPSTAHRFSSHPITILFLSIRATKPPRALSNLIAPQR